MARAMFIIGVGALLVGIIIYALIDCIRTDHLLVKILPKPVWALIIIFFPVAGALLWLFFGKARGSSSFGPVAQQTPRAPDDDDDYLRYLQDRSRREAESRRRAEQEEADRERERDEELKKRKEDEDGGSLS